MMSPAFLNAMERRDASYDGRFVFAVKTTGVYCRPSCPSRRPKRENVLLFLTPVEAEAAGFRPCLRCRPASPPPLLVARATRNARTAAKRDRFRQALREGADVTTAIYEAGYGSPSRVYENAAEWLGMTPAEYRHGGAGLAVRYATTRCPLGRLLVAATDRGVCSVKIGDADAPLLAELRSEFHAASLVEDKHGLGAWAADIAFSLGSGASAQNLPLHLAATEFQMKVWRALRAIPRGETRTYSQLARQLGMKNGARAVGNACASNPVALLVPCHRAIGEDGRLRGYRWGLERKQALLDLESGGIAARASKLPPYQRMLTQDPAPPREERGEEREE